MTRLFYLIICSFCVYMSNDIVDAGSVGLVSGEQSGCGDVGRMFGVDLDVGHGVDDSRKYYIPRLGGIFVDADLYRAEDIDLRGQSLESGLEIFGHLTTFGAGAREFERYNVFYHFYI